MEEHVIVELPARFALTLVDISDPLAYAGASQTAPVSQGASVPAAPMPAFSGVIDDAVSEAQTAAASGDGAQAQNVNSPNSTSYASAP